MRRIGVVLTVLLLLAGACTTEGEQRVAVASAGLERFDSCDELLEHVRSQALEAVGPYGLQGVHGIAVPLAMDQLRGTAVAEDAAGASAPDFSASNIQEAGVDEPDLVKTDGSRILALANNRLHHVSVGDGPPRLTGSLDLPGGWGHNLLVDGDRALVFLSPEFRDEPVGDDRQAAYVERTLVAVVDVSDPAAMAIVATLTFDGSYVSARFTGGVARLVVRSGGARLAFAQPEDGTPVAEQRATERNRELVASSTLADWVPGFVLERHDTDSLTEGSLAACDRTYAPEEFSGPGLVSVVTIDPADPTPRDAASVLADAQVVYASTDTLYVATTRWSQRPIPLRGEPVPDDPSRPAPEPVTPDDPSRPAPEPVTPDDPEPVTTEVHAFDITDPRRATYVASGAVEGSVLNQWSLSEHDGHVRVATTTDEWDAERSVSSVTVLARDGDRLEPVGHVGDLGRGERIYAVRFMGSVGYVVTFRQIDPLYVLDLRDPTRPAVLGELKIPGYSAYLHPVGEGLLLGVGQDATEEGVPLGTQMSLFDVSDPARPERLQHLRFDGAGSAVEHDHLAFLWWAPAGLAVLPLDIWAPEGREGGQGFTGAVAVRVGRAELGEVGRLVHPEIERTGGGVAPGTADPDMIEPSFPEDLVIEPFAYRPSIRRSVVVGATLYTYSEAGLLASDLDTLQQQAWIAF